MGKQSKLFLDYEANLFSQINIEWRSFTIVPFSLDSLLTFCKIALPSSRSNWVDNSSNTCCPPDFYSPKHKLMCEFMRVNEYEDENGYNPMLAHERDVINKLNVPPGSTVFLKPDHRKIAGMKHDYEMYLRVIDRVLTRHNHRVETYQSNHPGFKTIFVVFDETSFYVEADRHYERDETIPGEAFVAKRIHKPFLDKNILGIISNLQCDYVLWVSPFKNLTPDMLPPGQKAIKIPRLAMISVKNLTKIEAIEYDRSKLVSVESNMTKEAYERAMGLTTQ